MSPISRQVRHLKKAREIQVQKLKEKKDAIKRKFNGIIDETDESEFNITKERRDLHTKIDQLLEIEVKPAQHLLDKMRYPKGSRHLSEIMC